MIYQLQKEMLEFMSNHHNRYFVVPTSLKTDVFTVPAAAAPLLESHVCTPYYICASVVASQFSLLKQNDQTGEGRLH